MDILARQQPGRRSPRWVRVVDVLLAILLLIVGLFGLLALRGGDSAPMGRAVLTHVLPGQM